MIRTALALLSSSLLISASAPSSAASPMTEDCKLTLGATHIEPNFAAYRVPVDHAPPVPTRIRSRHERFFATRLRNAYRAGGIFAGHYAIALWGCGAGCREMAIVDYRTGVVHWLPQLHQFSTFDVGVEEGDFDAGLRFKASSRLLAFIGEPATDPYGTPDLKRKGVSLYEWRNDKLHLIRFVSGMKLCPRGY
jgi:hypothetical protein